MRIAFFTDTYLPTVDGIVRSLINYRVELEKRGHEVYIFCPGTRKQKKENKDDNVYYFTSTTFKPYPDYRIALFPFISAVKKVKSFDIDLIHSHGIATTGLAAIQCSRKLKIPAICSFHTLVPEGMHYITKNEKMQDFFKSVTWKYLKWYYSHFKNVLVPSNYIRSILNEKGINNTILHSTGINSKKFKNSKTGAKKIREKHSLGNSPLIIHVGRVALEKKIEYLINSADSILNIYPKAKFMIIGKGPAKEYYENLVKTKGLSKSFIFTGYVPDEDLPKYYSAADVFVFPSDFDTQGLVVLESLCSGTPVIVKKNSASAEFVKDSINGYVFSDHFDLPEKITESIKQNKKLKSNIKGSKDEFSIENSTDRLLSIYESMISSP